VSLLDSLPAGVTLVGAVTCQATGHANCGTVSGTTSTIQVSGAQVGAAGSGSLTLTASVAFAPTLITSPLVNTANASDTASQSTANGSSFTNLVPTANLSIAKTGPTSVAAGAPISYVITVSNAGPSAAHGAAFTDDLPSGISQITATCAPAGGGALCGSLSITGTRVQGSAFQLPAGGSIAVTVTGIAPTTGTLVDVARVAPPAGTEDSDQANNAATTTTTVTPAPLRTADVSISKTAAENVTAGTSIVYTLAISNAGPSTADGVTFTDDLPAGLSNITATCASAAGGAVCGPLSVTGLHVQGSASALPAGGSITVTVTGIAPGSGTLVNVAHLSLPAGVDDPNPANNTASATTTITPAPTAVPALSPVALALLVAAFLLGGLARARRLQRS
jgi:uncharacterized repeat protein (TIGR01451 family)